MIEFTGERLVPGKVNADLWAEHISRYHYAAQFAAGRTVLDIGCGAGYGTALLATTAHVAVGVDFATDAIKHARETYQAPNLNFTQTSATALPYANETFDLITAFEVIEHLDNCREMLREARRTLKPNGLFLVSTPNRTYYNESRGEAGPNPFHVHEFDYAEFAAELAEYFPHTQILLQNRVDAFAFYPPKLAKTGPHATADINTPEDEPENAYFFLGCCSIAEPPPHQSYLHVANTSNVLRDREHHIRSLQQELTEKTDQYNALARAQVQLETTLEQRTVWANNLNADLMQTQARIGQLQTHLEQQNAWALGLDRELVTARERHTHLENLLEERTRWAVSLDAELKTTRQDLIAARNEITATRNDLTTTHHYLTATHQDLNAKHQDLTTAHQDLTTAQQDLINARQELETAARRLNATQQILHEWQTANATSSWMRLGRKLKLGPQFPGIPRPEDK